MTLLQIFDLLPEWRRLATLEGKLSALYAISAKAALSDAVDAVDSLVKENAAQLRVIDRMRSERDEAQTRLAAARQPLIPKRASPR